MNLRLSVAVVGLVFFLQDRKSYNQFLTYRDGDAQTLLDLLQDVSTSLPMQFYFTQTITSFWISISFRSLSHSYSKPYRVSLVTRASILDVFLLPSCRQLVNKWRVEDLEISGKA
jgi:hypothetical protein